MSKRVGWIVGAVAAVVIAVLVAGWFVAARSGPEPMPTRSAIFDPSKHPERTAMAEAAARAWVTYDSSEDTERRVERLLDTFESTDGLQGLAHSARRTWAKREGADVQVRVTNVDAVVPVGISGGAWIYSVILEWEGVYTRGDTSETVADWSEFWVYVPQTRPDMRAVLIQER